MEKNASITIRVSEKTKRELKKLAQENKRDFSDYVRRALTEIADKKIKITI
jgi:predicted transcriptional regulator